MRKRNPNSSPARAKGGGSWAAVQVVGKARGEADVSSTVAIKHRDTLAPILFLFVIQVATWTDGTLEQYTRVSLEQARHQGA
jgi:hypothetical protein